MIKWIKFKGITDAEKSEEVGFLPFALLDNNNRIMAINTTLEMTRAPLANCTKWAPLDLPEEEKWERKIENGLYSQVGSSKYLEMEFDNIYSILNELRKR